MTAITFKKTVPGLLDYSVDWSSWLAGGETIATSSWSVEDAGDITIGTGDHADSNTGSVATVWLDGGTNGASYEVTNTIITDSTPPRTTARTIRVEVARQYE